MQNHIPPRYHQIVVKSRLKHSVIKVNMKNIDLTCRLRMDILDGIVSNYTRKKFVIVLAAHIERNDTNGIRFLVCHLWKLCQLLD